MLFLKISDQFNMIYIERRISMVKSTYKDKKELKNLVLFYKNNLEEEYIQIDIMFARKTTSKKHLYKTWMLVCKNKDIMDTLLETLNNMEKSIEEKSMDKYDLEISADESIQVVEMEKVINSKELQDALTLEYTDENVVGASMDYNKFDFVYVQLSDNTEDNPQLPITIVKKHLKYPTKLKGAKSFIINGNEAKVFNTPLLIIGSNVEAFGIDGYFYILNRNNFNTIMNFKDLYYKIVDANSRAIIESELFDNPEEFIEECRNNGRYVTRLTKAILAEGFKNARENKYKLQELKVDFKLKMNFTEDGKIVYQKECIDEILNLLLEHYVTSALTDKRLLALAIEKYE